MKRREKQKSLPPSQRYVDLYLSFIAVFMHDRAASIAVALCYSNIHVLCLHFISVFSGSSFFSLLAHVNSGFQCSQYRIQDGFIPRPEPHSHLWMLSPVFSCSSF